MLYAFVVYRFCSGCLCCVSFAGSIDEEHYCRNAGSCGIYTYFRKDWGDVASKEQLGVKDLFAVALMALGLGFYDGFFGPGTGSFLIFGFLFIGCDFVTAAGNAKALNFASGIGALLSFALSGSVLWVYGVIMAGGMIVGAIFGSRMAIKKGAAYVRPLYLLVTTLLIGKQVYEILFK